LQPNSQTSNLKPQTFQQWQEDYPRKGKVLRPDISACARAQACLRSRESLITPKIAPTRATTTSANSDAKSQYYTKREARKLQEATKAATRKLKSVVKAAKSAKSGRF